MSYTSIIINNGEVNVGTPIGISIPSLLGDIEKDGEYVLQFAIRNLNSSTTTLNYIYVGDQKLNDIVITNYETVKIEDTTFYNCYIPFVAESNMMKPQVRIGRLRTTTESSNKDVLEITRLKLSEGDTLKEYSPNSNDITLLKRELYSMIQQLSDSIVLKAKKTDVDDITDKVSKALGQIQVEAGKIEMKVEKDELSSTITQTAESIKLSVLEGGGYNYLRNSSFKNNTKYWNLLSWNNVGNMTDTYIQMKVNEAGNEWGLSNRNVLSICAGDLSNNTYETLGVGVSSDKIPNDGATEWTLSCLIASHRIDCVCIEIIEYNESGTRLSDCNYLELDGNKDGAYNDRSRYHNVNWKFTLKNANCASIKVVVYMNNWTGVNSTAFVFFAEPMLVKGHFDDLTYAENNDELYSGIVTIDKDGLTVKGTNSNTYTQASADGFRINKSGEDVFIVDEDGLYMRGNISGSTFSSNNDEFRVLEDGTVKSQSLVIEDLITTQTLNVDDINNPEYPKVLHRATTVYINSSAASDTSWYHGATYSSISEMLAYAPRNLNGYTLSITLNSNINENVSLSWFHSGQVNFNFNGYTVNGYVYCYGASMVYRLYGGVADDSKVGKVMPYTGSVEGSYWYAIEFQYCQFAVNNIQVYPDKVNGNMSSGLLAQRGATGCIFKLDGVGDLRYLVRAELAARIYVRQTSGTTNNATFCTNMGGLIQINSEYNQAGRNNTAGNPYWSGGGGVIMCNQNLGMDKITFSSTANNGGNTNPNTNTGETVTETVKATSADTYRSTVYNNWKGDGTVRQGDYGYGDCQGCWFFGNNLYNTMNAGTVTKVIIRIKRQEGGTSSAQTMTVKSHNHTSKPSGAPTYTNTIGTCSCAVGSYIDLVITDTATINKLKACKGIGLSIGTASSPYIVCSGSCQVIITYKKVTTSD